MKLSIIVTVLAFLPMTTLAVPDAPKSWEKCTGVSVKGKNDCGALDGSHGCKGMAKTDRSKNEWVYVAAGTCAKLGGTVAKTVPAKKVPPK